MTVSVLKIKDISWLRKYVRLEKDSVSGKQAKDGLPISSRSDKPMDVKEVATHTMQDSKIDEIDTKTGKPTGKKVKLPTFSGMKQIRTPRHTPTMGGRKTTVRGVKEKFPPTTQATPQTKPYKDTDKLDVKPRIQPLTGGKQSLGDKVEHPKTTHKDPDSFRINPSNRREYEDTGKQQEGIPTDEKDEKGEKTHHTKIVHPDVSSKSPTPREGAQYRKRLQAESDKKLKKLKEQYAEAEASKKRDEKAGKVQEWKKETGETDEKTGKPKTEKYQSATETEEYEGTKRGQRRTGGVKKHPLVPAELPKEKPKPPTTKPIKKKPLQADVKDVKDPAMKEIEENEKQGKKDKPNERKVTNLQEMTDQEKDDFVKPPKPKEEPKKEELKPSEGKIVQHRGQTPKMEEERAELEEKKEEEEEEEHDSRYPKTDAYGKPFRRKKLTGEEQKRNIKRLERKPSSPDKIIDENGKEIPRTKEHEAKGYGDHIPTQKEREKVITDRKVQSQGGDKPKEKESWEKSPDTIEYKRDTQEGGSKFHFGHEHGGKTGEYKQRVSQSRRELLGTDHEGARTDAKTQTKPHGGGGAKDYDETEGGGYTDAKGGSSGSGGEGDSLEDQSGASAGYGGGSEEDLSEENEYTGAKFESTARQGKGQRGAREQFPKAHPPTHFYRGGDKKTGKKGTWTKVPESLIQMNRDAGEIEGGSGIKTYHLEGKDEKTGITAQEVFEATEGKSNIRSRDDYEKYHKRDEEFNLKDEESKQAEEAEKGEEGKALKEQRDKELNEKIKLEGEYKTMMFGGNNKQKKEWNAKSDEDKAKDIKAWVDSGKGSKRQTKERTKAMYLIGQKLMAIRLKSLK